MYAHKVVRCCDPFPMFPLRLFSSPREGPPQRSSLFVLLSLAFFLKKRMADPCDQTGAHTHAWQNQEKKKRNAGRPDITGASVRRTWGWRTD